MAAEKLKEQWQQCCRREQSFVPEPNERLDDRHPDFGLEVAFEKRAQVSRKINKIARVRRCDLTNEVQKLEEGTVILLGLDLHDLHKGIKVLDVPQNFFAIASGIALAKALQQGEVMTHPSF